MSADFEARVAQAVRERDALDVDAGFNIACYRCSNEEFTPTGDAVDAQDTFHAAGWRLVEGYQLCPACLGTP